MTTMVELRGVNFLNKGAELMMHALVAGVRNLRLEANLVLAPSGMSPYIDRAKLGLYQKIWFQRFGVQWGYGLGKILPSLFTQTFGLVRDGEIDVVLDASGFAYSDQWGHQYTCQLDRASQRWARQGTRLVLMPQAFGPFETEATRRAMRRVGDAASLVFVRDSSSYDHLKKVVSPEALSRVHLMPDFTVLVPSVSQGADRALEGRPCLIVNSRVVDLYGVSGDFYRACFEEVIRVCRAGHLDPFFLIHEGPKDRALADAINSRLELPLEVVERKSALELKGVIGRARFVFGSRFHGLVSALSQGVPSVALGWSHKYGELFKDYGVAEMALDARAAKLDDVALHVRRLLEDDDLRSISAKLLEHAAHQKELCITMWRAVEAVICR
jgi:polysaccharide pyruvyl transferase WcaK-like protein